MGLLARVTTAYLAWLQTRHMIQCSIADGTSTLAGSMLTTDSQVPSMAKKRAITLVQSLTKYGKGTGLTPSDPQELAEVCRPALDANCWVHAATARQSLVQSQPAA